MNCHIKTGVAGCYPIPRPASGKPAVSSYLCVTSLLTILLAASPAALANDFIDLSGIEDLNGRSLNPTGIAADGNVIVGNSPNAHGRSRAYRWNALTGKLDDLGTLAGGDSASARAVNANGEVVVGAATDGNASSRAFRWTAADGMQSLGTLNGGSFSEANAVNAKGDVVVGSSGIGNGARHAFRWTEAAGMQYLGTLQGGANSTAFGVNAVGDVVVGEADNGRTDVNGNRIYRAFRWSEAKNEMEDLGTLAGDNSKATAVNATGNVVVGSSNYKAGDSLLRHAVRWIEVDGTMKIEDLGTLGGDLSAASAVNAKGDVVVGSSALAGNMQYRAFRWSAASGMQSIEDWLAAYGIIVKGPNTLLATGVNADGSAVIGQLDNGHGFLARASGMVDVPEFNAGLYRVANSALLAINDADLVMHGAHGNPMRTLLPVGRASFWSAGDIGQQQHGVYDSKQGVAEIGYGYRPSPALQFNVALGRSYNNAATGLGGETKARSTYVLPEFILSTPDGSTKTSLSIYYGQGDLRIDRAYLNAGNLTHAYGKPDTETLGARVRLDWLDAITVGKTSLTPYASLTYMQSRMDGYTELGNAFPVQWNKRREHATTARVGIDAVRTVNDTISVLANLEVAHRVENQGSISSGELLGAGGYAFGFSGQQLQPSWLRAGLGLEAKVGKGIAALTLNATTQGESPAYWLAANYRWVF